MSNKLKKIFCPSKTERIEQLKRLKEIAQSIPKGDCGRCKHYIKAAPNLPGYVTDWGECKKNMECFYCKVCRLEEVSCPCFEEETSFTQWYDERIKELQECPEQKT